MLSKITWINENDNDSEWDNNFNDVFVDSQTEKRFTNAKAVVHAAIDYWERIIDDFNFSDDTNEFGIYVSMEKTGEGHNLGGGETTTGVPHQGWVAIGRGNDTNGDSLGDGGGWFLDETPMEHSEFLGRIENPFVGERGTATGADLLTGLLHEIGHVLGLVASDKMKLLARAEALDPRQGMAGLEGTAGARLWTFDGPTTGIHMLMTAFDTAGSTVVPGFPNGARGRNANGPTHASFPRDLNGQPITVVRNNITYSGVLDLMNPSYDTARMIPSYADAMMLADAYGYSVRNPIEFGTFHAFVDRNGTLLVRGGEARFGFGSDDVIDIYLDGSEIVLSIEIGNEIPGTGVTNGFHSRFKATDIRQIKIESGDGNDLINIYANIFAANTFSIVGIDMGPGLNDRLQLWGTSGADSIIVEQGTMNVNGDTINFSGLDNLRIEAQNGDDPITIKSTSMPIQLGGGAGRDIFTVNPRFSHGQPSILAPVTLSTGEQPVPLLGEYLVVEDIAFKDNPAGAFGATWVVSNPSTTNGNTVQIITVAGGAQIQSFSDIENILLTGSRGNNIFNVESYQNGSALVVQGGPSDDQVNFTPSSGNLLANITSISAFQYYGGAEGGNDVFRINNSVHNASWQYTRTSDILQTTLPGTSYFAKYGVSSGVERVEVNGGPQGDTFVIEGSPAGSTTTFIGAGGRDQFTVLADPNNVAAGLQGIRGPVQVYPSSDEAVTVVNSGDTTGRTVHIKAPVGTATRVGNAAGDNLFGPGGYLEVMGTANVLSISLGTGADTVVAVPNPTMPLLFQAGNPTTAPGDSLQVLLAGITNPGSIAPTPDRPAYYTFGNAAYIAYQGFESSTLIIPGDFSGNRTVGQEDHAIWRAKFGSVGTLLMGDGNADGVVDTADYVIWRKNLGATLPATASGAKLQDAQPVSGGASPDDVSSESKTAVLSVATPVLIQQSLQPMAIPNHRPKQRQRIESMIEPRKSAAYEGVAKLTTLLVDRVFDEVDFSRARYDRANFSSFCDDLADDSGLVSRLARCGIGDSFAFVHSNRCA